MKTNQRFNRLMKRAKILERLAQEQQKEIDILRAEESYIGRENTQLLGRDKWLLQQIEGRGHPVFRCDLVRAQDVMDACVWLDPNTREELSLSKIGRMMTRIGRYARRQLSVDQRNYKVWILRNHSYYLTLAASMLWEEYERQQRNNVPPGYRFGDSAPISNPYAGKKPLPPAEPGEDEQPPGEPVDFF